MGDETTDSHYQDNEQNKNVSMQDCGIGPSLELEEYEVCFFFLKTRLPY